MYKKLFLHLFICIFVISHNHTIPGVEQSEVCYKTQRLAALPRQLQGDGTCMSGAVGASLGGPCHQWGGRVASARLASASDRKPCFPLQEHPSSVGGRAVAASGVSGT